jgi:Carboxypeptidase regulatory-like domain
MRPASYSRINLLLALAIIVLISLGCDDFVSLHGRLVDQDGKPVAGAKIVIIRNSQKAEETSREDGRFEYFDSVSPIGSSTVSLTITKEGFETCRVDYNSRELPINPNVNKEFPAERVIVLKRKGE